MDEKIIYWLAEFPKDKYVVKETDTGWQLFTLEHPSNFS